MKRGGFAYGFVPTMPRFSKSVKFGNFMKARRERKRLMKKFCSDVGITRSGGERKCHLPDEYILRLDRVSYLGTLRDRMVIEGYEEYLYATQNLLLEIARAEESIVANREHLAKMQEVLVGFQKEMKAAESREERLTLQGKCDNQKAKINNYKEEAKHNDATLRELQGVNIKNAKVWEEHVKDIDSELLAVINKYMYSATKKVRNKIGYTKFFFVMPGYGLDAEKVTETRSAIGQFGWASV